MMILVSAISAVVLIYIGIQNGSESIQDARFQQLTSIKAAKKNQIEAYLNEISHLTEVMGENDMIIQALVDFKTAFQKIGNSKLNEECSQQLSSHYEDFVDKLSQNLAVKNDPDMYYPNTVEACYLQYEYIIENPNISGEKHLLLDAKDGTDYNKYHIKYHEHFTNLIQKFGFYDMFLVDLERGDIVYTVFKETDFGTNLFYGPYRESNLATLVRQLKTNVDLSQAAFIDFDNYRPSYGAPAAFVGIPITRGPETVGALVFQFPVDAINRIMTGYQQWEEYGLGESGETYLVGEDYKMRSVSRFFLQDSIGYTNALLEAGYSKDIIDKMFRLGTTILYQTVKTEAAKDAIAGDSGIKIITDYRDVDVLSAYEPLQFNGLNWAILSEIDEAEAFASIYDFEKTVFIALCIIIMFVTFLAMYLAGQFVKPIDKLAQGVRRIKEGDYNQKIEVNSNDEFGTLAKSYNEMVTDIAQQKEIVSRRNAENKRLLLNFIPESVAQRIQAGEEDIADLYPNVTVISIDLAEFNQVTITYKPVEVVHLFNQLLEAMDAAADKHGVNRIRMVGDTYLAVCGMFAPRLDHAKKVFEFALEVRQLVHQFNINYQTDLHMHFALHSGEVAAGIMGKERFNFDLWGKVVSEVEIIRKNSELNEIYVSNSVYQKIKEFYEFVPVDISIRGVQMAVWKYANKKVED